MPARAQDQATVVATCGAAHLTAGTQAFRQVDTNGVTCSAGGGSAVVSSVWSASDAAATSMTLSNGGLTVTQPNAVWGSIRGSTSHATGKYYVEFLVGPSSPTLVVVGLANAGFVVTSYLSTSIYSEGSSFAGGGTIASAGFVVNTNSSTYTPASGDVFQIAVDFDAGKIWLGVNNASWPGVAGNPATGTAPWVSIVAPALGLAFYPAISLSGPSATWTLQSTAASQKYAAPSGFTAWDSGGAGCSQATAYLARATGETAHAADLTALICGLVSDGVWAKLDALYILAQQTQADAKLNLIGTSYTLPTTTATFTTYQGYKTFPAGGIDTGFNASTALSPQFTQNNASLTVWCYDKPANNTIQIGSSSERGGHSPVLI